MSFEPLLLELKENHNDNHFYTFNIQQIISPTSYVMSKLEEKKNLKTENKKTSNKNKEHNNTYCVRYVT